MWTHTRESQQTITPDMALTFLKEGNRRFVNNLKINRNLLNQVNQTSAGQYPFAAILSCIDSRTSAELIFDQGLGDIFSIRIAGNVLNDDILGSMEYACKVANSRLVLVLGHTRCGAVTSACKTLELGHFTGLLGKLQPAIDKVRQAGSDYPSISEDFIDQVSIRNVEIVLRQIRKSSNILTEMEANGTIRIVGGLYNIETGEVSFFEQT
jgi:carbonic anhydrase